MSSETKLKAISKLNKMKLSVGIDEFEIWPQTLYAYNFKTSAEGGVFINNILAYQKAMNEYYHREYTAGNPVNKNIMVDAPQTVNAYYLPTANKIKILAGILQAPVYSIESSMEEKIGGVGTIIAHEITHAFDYSGSQFDENGNQANWWQETDRENFIKETQKIVNYYNGFNLNDKNINGSLTLSENIADLGAVACITEYALTNQLNLKDVYIAYTKLFAIKIRPEALLKQILTDVHSPAKIRVNAVLSATDEFYTAFDIKETDGMYIPKEERPSLW